MTQTTFLPNNTHLKIDVQSHPPSTNNRIKSLHRLIKVSKTYQRTPTRAVSLFIILAISTYVITFDYDIYHHIGQFIRPNKLKCVYALGTTASNKDLGAFIQENQLASFISSAYDLPLQFPSYISQHEDDLSEYFGKCPGDVQPKDIPLRCQMDFQNMRFERCPAGDCRCKLHQVNEDLGVRRSECDVLGIWPDQMYNREFSGCLRRMMMRYFGNDTKPKQEYNVVQYRAGETDGENGNRNPFRKEELFFIVKAMCYMNKLPIVVLTNGAPELPKCMGPRVFSGSDLSQKEIFKIVQHAKTIAVDESTSGFALMEVAKPERVVMMERSVRYYDWIECEKWTIIGPRGAVFHFKSKDDMVRDIIDHPSSRHLGRGHFRKVKRKGIPMMIPEQDWRDIDLFEKAIEITRFADRLPSVKHL